MEFFKNNIEIKEHFLKSFLRPIIISYIESHVFWKNNGIDFEDSKYSELVDLQIAGNGWGGIGRTIVEADNQRFLIQIFPKIGDINELTNLK